MDLGVVVPDSRVDTVTPFAKRVESLGYRSLWIGELWGVDAPTVLGSAAAATDRLHLGTAIINAYSRTPATVAMIGATLDRLSDGRATLGLGPSTPRAIQTIHGYEFDDPIGRLAELATIVRRLLAADDERVSFEGSHFSVTDLPSLQASVDLYNAALGPANRRLTGRRFDGWLPHNIPFSSLDEAFEMIATASNEAGRDPAEIAVSVHLPTAIAPDLEAARDQIRAHIAYYVGTGPGYRRAVAMVYPDAAERIAAAWADGRRGAARNAVTDTMIEDLGIAATPDTAWSEIARLSRIDCIDECRIVFPAGADTDMIDTTLETLAPANLDD